MSTLQIVGSIIALIVFVLGPLDYIVQGWFEHKKYKATNGREGVGYSDKYFAGIILLIAYVLILCSVICVVKAFNKRKETLPPETPSQQTEESSIYESETDTENESDSKKSVDNKEVESYSGFEMVNGNYDGYGEILYKDGDIYKGYMKNGRYEGEGTYHYFIDEGIYDTYIGEWKNGFKDGDGECRYIWSDGREYKGAFRNGKRYGDGWYLNWYTIGINGEVRKGKFYGSIIDVKNTDGIIELQFDGYGEFYYDNGDTFKGKYEKGTWISGDYCEHDGTCWRLKDKKFEKINN